MPIAAGLKKTLAVWLCRLLEQFPPKQYYGVARRLALFAHGFFLKVHQPNSNHAKSRFFMFRSLALFIGLRYVRAKRRDRFVSLTTLISILCVTLGVFVLIVVLSVMNGFANEIRNRLLSMESHVLLKDLGVDWQTAMAKAKKHPEVIGAAPILQQPGLISVGTVNKGVAIRGIDAKLESEISDIGSKMVYGSLEDLDKTPYGIVLGYEVASLLFGSEYIQDLVNQAKAPASQNKNSSQHALPIKPLYFDEKILLTVPIFQVTIAGTQARSRRFQVVGIFRINFNQYDTDMVLVNLRDARRLADAAAPENGGRAQKGHGRAGVFPPG